jgi:hypothetical protein
MPQLIAAGLFIGICVGLVVDQAVTPSCKVGHVRVTMLLSNSVCLPGYKP